MGDICQLIGIGPSTGFKVICSVMGSLVFCGIFTAVGFKMISSSRYSYVVCSIFFPLPYIFGGNANNTYLHSAV